MTRREQVARIVETTFIDPARANSHDTGYGPPKEPSETALRKADAILSLPDPRIEVLVTALEFYANGWVRTFPQLSGNEALDPTEALINDLGECARRALAQVRAREATSTDETAARGGKR